MAPTLIAIASLAKNSASVISAISPKMITRQDDQTDQGESNLEHPKAPHVGRLTPR